MADKYQKPISTRLFLVAFLALGALYLVSHMKHHPHGWGHDHAEMHDAHGHDGHGDSHDDHGHGHEDHGHGHEGHAH